MKSTRRNKFSLKKKSIVLILINIAYIIFLGFIAFVALKCEYVKIVLETILSPIMIGVFFYLCDSIKTDYDEYLENLAHDYKKEEESD
jgi:hypothetical protein